MAEPIVAQITLRSANSIKNQDEVESLAAALTAALKLKQSHAGTALKLAVQLGEAQSKPASVTDEAFKCSKLPFTQVRSHRRNGGNGQITSARAPAWTISRSLALQSSKHSRSIVLACLHP
jgi:hypothetical protein